MLFRKLSKSALALVLALSVACPMVANAEETNVPVPEISVEQPIVEEGNQIQTEQSEVVSKPIISVSAADHNPKKYKVGATAKEPIELKIQHDKAFIYSIQWTEDDKYSAPTNMEEKVESQPSGEPVTLVLAGNETGAPVKYHITAVEEGQDESQQTSFDIVVDLPKNSGKKTIQVVETTDLVGQLKFTKPASAVANPDVNTKIEIWFNEAVTLAGGGSITDVALKYIAIAIEKVPADPAVPRETIAFKATYDSSKNIITLAPNQPLEKNTNYEVTFPASAVKNSAGKVNIDKKMPFTTADDTEAPTYTMKDPTDPKQTKIDIKLKLEFNEPLFVKGVVPKKEHDSTSVDNLFELLDADGKPVTYNADYDPLTYTVTLIPSAELVPGKDYALVIAADKLQDFNGNLNTLPIVGTFTTIADDKAPVPTFTPLNNATAVDPASNLTISFNETVYLVTDGTPLSSATPAQLGSVVSLKDNSNNSDVPFSASYDAPSRTLTINPTQDLSGNRLYTLTLLDNKVRDQLKPVTPAVSTTFKTKVDTVAPTFSNVPTDNATEVLLDSNIVLTFSEVVTLQSTSYNSYITIRNTTTNSTVPFTGSWDQGSNTLTIDPNTDLEANRSYSVAVAANLVRDAGNIYNAARAFTFTTTNVDTSKPSATMYPAHGATGISLNTHPTITFSEYVTMANGAALPGTNPYSSFYLVDNNNTVIAGTYSYDAANYRLTFQPNQLLKSNTTYRLILVASVVRDRANLYNVQTISSFTTFNDNTVPTATLYPWHGYSSYPVEGNLKITFSEPVYLSNGTAINNSNASSIFVLRDNSTGSNVTSNSLSYNATTNELTIDPTANLKNNTSYTLTVIQNSVRDSANHYVGQTSSVFTTATDANPPTINFSPSNGSTGNAVTTNITLSFSEPVSLLSSDYASYITLRENGKTVNMPFTVSWNSSSQQLVLDPTNDLLPNRTYYVTVAAGLVKDQTNNPNSSTVMYFSTQNDYNAPTFTTNPISGTTGIPITNDVSVTVSEPFTHYDGTEVTSQNASGIVSLVDSRNKTVESTIIYSPANRTFLINPVSVLRSNEEYRIVIASGKIKDLAGNTNSSFTSTFRTVYYGVPYISSDITNGQTNIAISRPFHISFSENIFLPNGTSITNSNVGKILTFKDGEGKNVPFSASWDAGDLTITVEPKGKLQPSTYYYIRIEAGTVQNVNGVKNSLFSLSFSTVNDSDLPTAESAPENGEENVPLDTEIYVQFSKPVVLANGSKLTNQNADSLVQLKNSAGLSVKYKVDWDEENLILTLNPSTRLKKNEAYTIFLPEGVVKDDARNPVLSYTASFYTIQDKGLVKVFSNPMNGDEDVPTNEQLYIGFDESVTLKNNAKITSTNLSSVISVYDENMKKLNVKFTWDDKKYLAKIIPSTALKPNSTYSIVVGAGKVYNRLKKTNAGYIVTFNTSTEDTPPEVLTLPEDGDKDVSVKGNIEVIFKESVTLTNGTELTNDNVAKLVKIIDENGKSVACKFKWIASSQKIVIDPKLNLKKDHTYTIYMEAGVVSDLSGNLNEEFFSQFTTANK